MPPAAAESGVRVDDDLLVGESEGLDDPELAEEEEEEAEVDVEEVEAI